MATTLEEVKRLALELTADERQKLLDYLKPISEPPSESTQIGGSQSRRKKSLAEYRPSRCSSSQGRMNSKLARAQLLV